MVEGAELIVLPPLGGGEEGAWLDVLPPDGGGVLLTGEEPGELLDSESVELLPPYIGGTLSEVDRDDWLTPLLEAAWLCEELDRLSVGAEEEAEPVGNGLTDVVNPLEYVDNPLLLLEDVPLEDAPLELVYWLGEEAEFEADELLRLRVDDTPEDVLSLL